MTERFMYDKLDERWPGLLYAEELIKRLREKKLSKANAKALAYLHGEVSDVNKAALARFHLGGLFDTHPDDKAKGAFHQNELRDIDRVTVARVICHMPYAMGFAALTKEQEDIEAEFYEGLSLNLVAWARSKPSQKALKALRYDRLETRAKFSKALYALINGLCQDGVLKKELKHPFENPSYFWLLCETSIHLSMVRTTEEGRTDNLQRARLMLMAKEQGLPSFTEQVQGKEAYERFDGIIRHCADQYAQTNESFKRSRWARFNRAFADWIEELEEASQKNSFLGPANLVIYGRRKPRPSKTDSLQKQLTEAKD